MTTGILKIPLSLITAEGFTIADRIAASRFIVLKEMIATGEAEFLAPLDIDVTLTAQRGYYDVAGRVAGQVGLTCSRCLASFTHSIDQRFNLRFSQEIPQDLGNGEGQDLELTADQIGLLFFTDNELDLQDAIQEQVVLALPFKPLCSAACKGLCPKCGADLNHETCHCADKGSGGPFEVLRNLK